MITGYHIQWENDKGIKRTRIITGAKRTRFIWNDLSAGTTHYFRVAATNEDGTGAFSEPVIIRTPPLGEILPLIVLFRNYKAAATQPR